MPNAAPLPTDPLGGNGKGNGEGNGASKTPADAPAHTSASHPGERDAKGKFAKGHSGNPKGRPTGRPSLNEDLIDLARKFKVSGKDGKKQKYLEALLIRGLQDPHICVKILDKLFVDATPKEGIVVNNNNSLESILGRLHAEKEAEQKNNGNGHEAKRLPDAGDVD